MKPTYSAWEDLINSVLHNCRRHAAESNVIIILILICVCAVKVWRSCCASQPREASPPPAPNDRSKTNIDVYQQRRAASPPPGDVSLPKQAHSWQSSSLRRRIVPKNKKGSVASRHFQADDVAGIPIGYYAVKGGDSLENEIVSLYENQ